MLSARGGTVLGIDVKENSEAAQKAVGEFGLTFPNLRDRDGSFVRKWGQTGYPENYVLDRRGPRGRRPPLPGDAEVARRDAAAAPRRVGLMRAPLGILLARPRAPRRRRARRRRRPAAARLAPRHRGRGHVPGVRHRAQRVQLRRRRPGARVHRRAWSPRADQGRDQGPARRGVRPARAGRARRRRLRAHGLGGAVLAALAALALVLLVARRWYGRGRGAPADQGPAAPGGDGLDPDDARRLDAELAAYDR